MIYSHDYVSIAERDRRIAENLLVKIYCRSNADLTTKEEKIKIWFNDLFKEDLYWLGNTSHSYKSEIGNHINEYYIEFLPRTKEQAMLLKLVWSNVK